MTPSWLTPNWFATPALFLWPVIAFILYQVRPVNQATIWTILGGWLLLPVDLSIKFPMIPQFDKASIPNIAALIGCVAVLWRPGPLWYRIGLPDALIRLLLRPWHRAGLPEVFLLMLLIGPFITAELNSDPLIYGRIALPAESHYDAFSAVIAQVISLVPFFIGRQILRTGEDNEQILRALVVAGLIYSLPMFFEIRMSPQLHTWVYGYDPHTFAQQVRDGGYRASVFLGHGLIVAFFTMTTAVAAAAFWRARVTILRLPASGTTAYLTGVLYLCKALGALVYAVVLIPIVRFMRPQLQVRVATILAALVFSYPLLRTADLVPTEIMLDAAQSVSNERAQSLKTRFVQEQKLLDRASDRVFFGWGRFGRNRNYDSQGKDITLTDGFWIITLGTYGIFGFVAGFGLLAMTVFRAASALKFAKTESERIYLAALSLIVAVNMIDLLPNASLFPLSWLLAGSLLGRAEALRSSRRILAPMNSRVSAQRIWRVRI